MDIHLSSVIEKRVQETIKNLKKNNMNGYYAKSNKELFKLLDTLIEENDTVSVGGSMTLFETGVIDYLKTLNIRYLDRYKDNLQPADRKQLYRDVFSSNVYLSSTNAITVKGELYNVDGTGNRVAAMIYGPDKVIIISGFNKIVDDIEEAKKRNKFISAPANVKRLNRNTPCLKTGYCVDCKSIDKICNIHTIINNQIDKDRIHVIILNEQYGY
jgi:L-lactate utilization protein LutB